MTGIADDYTLNPQSPSSVALVCAQPRRVRPFKVRVRPATRQRRARIGCLYDRFGAKAPLTERPVPARSGLSQIHLSSPSSLDTLLNQPRVFLKIRRLIGVPATDHEMPPAARRACKR